MIERAMQWQSLVSARSLLLARVRECFCAILRGTWRALQIDAKGRCHDDDQSKEWGLRRGVWRVCLDAKNRLPTVHEIIKNVKEVSGDFLLSRVHERGLKIENECV